MTETKQERPVGGAARIPDDRGEAVTTADIAGATREGPAGQKSTSVLVSPPSMPAAAVPRRPTEDQMSGSNGAEPLFDRSAADDLRGRWGEIQTGFVDEPRSSVEEADKLVAEVIKRLAEAFASERGDLERQWSQGGDVSTEDLRVALRRYRSFFDRLLAV